MLKLLDILIVGLIIGQVIGRWGNFFNGEAYGAVVTKETLMKQGIPTFIINGMYMMVCIINRLFYMNQLLI